MQDDMFDALYGKLPAGVFLLDAQAHSVAVAENTSHFNGCSVLLAEDNNINAIIARRFMEKWGLTVDCTVTGEEAVKKIQEQHYDLVLMDLQMPVMDGYTATELIRALPGVHFRSVPIIALTASMLSEIGERIKMVGMTDCILKPFDPAEMYLKLHKYISRPYELNMI